MNIQMELLERGKGMTADEFVDLLWFASREDPKEFARLLVMFAKYLLKEEK